MRRVRMRGLCLCVALCAVGGWLLRQEIRVSDLPLATREEQAAQAVSETRLRLKQLSLVFYLAKVNRNALLSDVLGITGTEEYCSGLDDLRSLSADSPCAASLRIAMEQAWAASFGEDGPKRDETILRDRWNSPLMLNLSEQSCGLFGIWCPEDTIGSAGPDGKLNTPDDIRESVPQHLGPAAAAKAVK